MGRTARSFLDEPRVDRRAAEVSPPPPAPVSHTREKSPVPQPTAESPRAAAFFADGNDDIDGYFDALVQPAHADAGDRPSLSDDRESAEVRALFAQIAASYVRPVRDFMMELSWGDAPRQWIDICEPAIRALRRSAAGIEDTELCEALDAFCAGLTAVAESDEATITGELKERLVSSYARLASVMPPAFALDGERGGREPIIIQSLLAQIPDVGKVTTDKLYAAGLTSLDVFCMACADDLTFVAGIAPELSERIVAKFQEYRRSIEASSVDAGRSGERARLAEITHALRVTDAGYRGTTSGWDDAELAEHRRLRQVRGDLLLEANVLLARLGEIDRVRCMARLQYRLKIEQLEAFLREADK